MKRNDLRNVFGVSLSMLHIKCLSIVLLFLLSVIDIKANEPFGPAPKEKIKKETRTLKTHRGFLNTQKVAQKTFLPFLAGADVGIEKSASQTIAAVGDNVTFTLKVYNEGTADASGVVVTDSIPAGTAFVSAAPAAAYNNGQWNVGTVAAGDTLTFSYTVTILSDGVAISQAEVTAMTDVDMDSTPGNYNPAEDDWSSTCVSIPIYYCNTGQIEIAVEAPTGFQDYVWYRNGVAVASTRTYTITDFGDYHYDAKTANGSACPVELCCPIQVKQKCLSLGNLVWYDANNDAKKDVAEEDFPNIKVLLYSTGTDDIKNGNDILLDSTFTDADGLYNFANLAEGNYYVKLAELPSTLYSSTGQGVYDSDRAGPYENGADPDNNLDSEDDGTDMPGTGMVMSGVITLAYDSEPINDGDNDANTNNTVDFGLYEPKVFDLALTKKLAVGQTNLKPGDNVTFTLTVFNQGDVDALNVAVSDYIPTGLTLAAGSTWTVNSGVATNGIALVPANSSQDIDITFVINADFTGTSIVNNAEISSADDDTDSSNTPPTDKDSTPDKNPSNDGTPKNDVVSEDGKNGGDEDDSDPEQITIVQPNPTLSLGNLVWTDANNNGIKDPSEDGLDGVAVELYSLGTDGVKGGGDDVLEATQLTSNGGQYLFTGLVAGNYYAKLPGVGIPSGMVSSTGGGAYDASSAGIYEPSTVTDSNNTDNGSLMAGTTMIMSPVIELVLNAEPINDGDTDSNTNLTVDFGLYTPQVFDLALAKKLKVGQSNLKPGDNVTYTISVTNQGTVPAYNVEVSDYVPTGLTLAAGSAWTVASGVASTSVVTLAAGESQDIDITFVINTDFTGTSIVNTAEISNADDDTDTGNTPPTDKDSTPDKNPSNDGTPKNDVVSEDGKKGGDEDDSDPEQITIVQPNPTLSIGNLVWNDANNNGIKDPTESGIDSVTVELYTLGNDGVKGGGDDVLAGTQVTANGGQYSFTGLAAGSYFVKLPGAGLPAGTESSNGTGTTTYVAGNGAYEPGVNTDTNNQDHGTQMGTMIMSEVVVLTIGGEPTNDDDIDSNTNYTIDFGIYHPAVPAPQLSLGNLVWNDKNNDGIKDANEPGIDGVVVQLYSVGADGAKGGNDDVLVDTQITANDGQYLFTGLDAGVYYAKLTGVGIPQDFVSSTGDGSEDNDGDGAFEPGVNSDINDQDHGTQMGTMVMSDLVELDVFAEPTNDGDTDNNTNLTIDFGLYFPDIFDLELTKRLADGQTNVVSPGDTLVYTLDVRNIGTIDADSVVVIDYLPQSLILADDNWVDAGGVVVLINPIPSIPVGGTASVNIVTIIDPAFTGGSIANFASLDVPLDTFPDNNIDTIVIVLKEKLLSLGNLVWNDVDNDGIKDFSENGIAGVTLELYNAGDNGKDATDTLKATVTTDAQGNYLFTDLIAGNYYVKISGGVPSGMISSTGNGDTDTGTPGAYEPGANTDIDEEDHGTQMGTMIMSDIVVLEYEGEPTNDGDGDNTTNLTVDFGLYEPIDIPAGLSGRTFLDCNNDGLMTGDSPVAGVTVTLSGNANQTTTTDANGVYSFGAVPSGDYTITFSLPNGTTYATQNLGTNDAIDSDVDNTGSTGTFAVVGGIDQMLDAGYRDTQAPTWTSALPADVTADCGALPALPALTAIDTYDTSVNITISEVKTNGACQENYVIRRTWTATDDCGNESKHTQTITVRDNTAPTFNATPVIADITVACDAVPSPIVGVFATDNCDNDVAVTYDQTRLAGSCTDSYVLVRTWTASDNCGNQTPKVQRITVQDIIAPVINNLAVADITVECGTIPAAAVLTATDICDQQVAVTMTSITDNITCGQLITRTWTATDDCNNTSTFVQKITARDNTAPVFANVPAAVTINCGQNVAVAPTATDNCDQNVQITMAETASTGDCATGRTVTRTFTATDDCGNTSTFVQTVTVQDTQAPSITTIANDITVDCKDVPPPAKVTVIDNCPDAVMVMFDEQKTSGDNCSGFRITRTWTAMDACGNQSTIRQNITIKGDNAAPTIVGVPANADFDCLDKVPDAPTVTATDDCDSNPKITYTEDKLGEGCGYKLIRNWVATDKCGNTTAVAQTITVRDRTAPIITGVPADATVDCGDALPSVATPVASDACNITATLTFVETISGDKASCEYSVIRTWTATDQCGNKLDRTQTITVRDLKAPTITPNNPLLVGVPSGSEVTVECDKIPVMDERDVTASDNCDKAPSVKFEEFGAEKKDCLKDGYSFRVTCRWTATDKCGNTSTYEFTLKVKDTKAPVFSNTPANLTLNCGETVPQPTAPTVADNCDKDIDVSFKSETSNGTCAGSRVITNTWTATDDCGNKTVATQTITIEDKTAPVIANIPANQTTTCGQAPSDTQKPTVTDNCDNAPTLTYADEASATGGCLGSITRTWTATDACGNSVTATQTIKIEDKVAPILVGVPANQNASCDAVVTVPTVTATDNCDNNVKVEYKEEKVGTGCQYKLIRTWTATDACGNTALGSQVINISDNVAPTITLAIGDITVNCNDIPTAVAATATDDCDKDVTVINTDEKVGTGCNYQIKRTYTATDDCGNTSTKVQNITVRDTEGPVLTFKDAILAAAKSGDTLTFSCDKLPAYNEASAEAKDDCSGVKIIKNDQRVEFIDQVLRQGNCKADGYTHLLYCEWRAEDECGNKTSWHMYAKIVDNTAPVLAGVPANVTLSCGATVQTAPTVTAKDNCTQSAITVTFAEAPYTGTGACIGSGSVIRTWTATDDCGNTATATQLILISDTEKPEIIGVSADITLNEGENEPVVNVKASDKCDPSVKLEVAKTESGDACNAITTYTYTATDACGNIATASYKVTRKKSTDLVATIDVVTRPDSCSAKNGSAILSPATYTYTWADGTVGANRNNLAAGEYSITVSEGCAQKVIKVTIAAECVITPTCKTPELASQNVTDSGCGNAAAGSIVFEMKDGANADYTFNWSSNKGNANVATGLSAGIYSVTVTRVNNVNCSAIFTFDVKAKGGIDIFEGATATYDITDCTNGKAAFCTKLTSQDITNGSYTITDNDAPYLGTFRGCKFDTSFFYKYTYLPGAGQSGPYVLNGWTINGKTYTGEFADINELVTQMNGWDAKGNWKVTASQTIAGGVSTNVYSKMDVRLKNDPSASAVLDLDSKLTPSQMALQLGVGEHILKVISSDGCTDEIKVTVTCTPPSDDCKSFITDRSKVLFTACGTAAKICLSEIASAANYTITDNGNPYNGTITACQGGIELEIQNGVHQMIFIDKSKGCRDTIDIKVACTSARIVKETIYVGQKDTVCIDVAELIGNFKDLRNIWPTKSGEHARFDIMPGSRCITCAGIEAGGMDEAAFVIEDDKGVSDTTYFQISVIERVAAIPSPKALADAADGKEAQVMVLDVLANDKLGNAPVTKIEVVAQPRNGRVSVNNENKLVFTPDAGFCDDKNDESFTYRVCTAGGCDEAPVTVKVLCSDIKVYTGFSPNGDGVNDFFTIEGIKLNADNKLTIFNRYGNVVYFKEGYRNDWDGTWEGKRLSDGTYFYLFEDGEGNTKAGYLQLQR